MPPQPLKREFAFTIMDVARLLRTYADQRGRQFGISRAQWAVLMRIDRNEGLKQSELADMLDLHESTISRVTTQKYMLTPRGTYELKYFFGSHVATDTGGAASATAIRALIKQLIGAEDSRTPLTDSRIAEVLGEQGILVARRTIAKYREALQIPPVNLRRSP